MNDEALKKVFKASKKKISETSGPGDHVLMRIEEELQRDQELSEVFRESRERVLKAKKSFGRMFSSIARDIDGGESPCAPVSAIIPKLVAVFASVLVVALFTITLVRNEIPESFSDSGFSDEYAFALGFGEEDVAPGQSHRGGVSGYREALFEERLTVYSSVDQGYHANGTDSMDELEAVFEIYENFIL